MVGFSQALANNTDRTKDGKAKNRISDIIIIYMKHVLIETE